MQHILFFFMLLLPAVALADVTVDGQTFPLHFEDSALTTAVRAAIDAGVSAFWSARTNATVEIGVEGIIRGRIFDDAMYAAPYATPGLDVPKWIIATGPNLALRVPRDFSSAFLAPSILGFAEVPSGATESAAIRFVALLPASSSASGPYDYGVCRVGWDGRRWVLLSFL